MHRFIARLLALAVVLFLASTVSAQQAEKAAPTSPNQLNLNAATVEQLEALPGVGPKTAQLIVEYRQKSGGFKKVEELMNVKGIGEKSFLKLKPMVAVGAKPDKSGGSQ